MRTLTEFILFITAVGAMAYALILLGNKAVMGNGGETIPICIGEHMYYKNEYGIAPVFNDDSKVVECHPDFQREVK